MPQVLAQVVLPHVNGMPRETAVNTFTFNVGAVTVEAIAAAAGPAIQAFYNDAPGIDPLASYLSRNRTRVTDASEIRWTEITGHLNGTPAGPPFLIEPWTLGAASSSGSLPEEVAVALSFHGSLVGLSEFGAGVRPKARHRGRVYIGPFNDNVIFTDGTTFESRPSSDLRGDILAAAEGLMDADVGWSVWSRRNANVYLVVGGWVDNAWDTIRGRGPQADIKQTFGSVV